MHLSSDPQTSRTVGKSHGKPVVYEVGAGRMHEDGYVFYLSENGVWLTENVPEKYLRKI